MAVEESPGFISPMLAAAADGLPADVDRDWACEVKWDGLRVVAAIDGGDARTFTRTGRPVDLPAAARLAAALGPRRRLVLDGELIGLGDDGLPSFAEAMAARRELAAPSSRAVLVLFDVLHVDGRSVRDLPYAERRTLLRGLVPAGAGWDVPAERVGEAAAFVEATRAGGLEGVVLKRLDSPYVPDGRPGTWRKLRHVRTETFAIAGWAPGADGRRTRAGSVILAADDGAGGLVYCGRVGSGLTEAAREGIPRLLEPHVVDAPPVAGVPLREARGWVWVEPIARCAVEYLAWSDHKAVLRNPVLVRILGPGEDSPLARRTSQG